MIKFFRQIRQNLIMENKTGKPAAMPSTGKPAVRYLKYAIGEIVLVVIGILIALQINNWNEGRKQSLSTKISIRSIISDLQKDSIQLRNEIDNIESDIQMLSGFRDRLSKPTATLDTLKQIARYEYIPFFDPSNELNRNTIISLLSTGNIEYLDEDLKSVILSHNSEQLKLIKIMDENVSIFLNSQYNQGLILESEIPGPFESPAFIKGPLLEKYWSDMDDKQFLNSMISKISGKTLMDQILLSSKNELLAKTNETLAYLNDFMKKYD